MRPRSASEISPAANRRITSTGDFPIRPAEKSGDGFHAKAGARSRARRGRRRGQARSASRSQKPSAGASPRVEIYRVKPPSKGPHSCRQALDFNGIIEPARLQARGHHRRSSRRRVAPYDDAWAGQKAGLRLKTLTVMVEAGNERPTTQPHNRPKAWLRLKATTAKERKRSPQSSHWDWPRSQGNRARIIFGRVHKSAPKLFEVFPCDPHNSILRWGYKRNCRR